MADSAVARLRGILADTMTRTDIDQLLTDVRAGWADPDQPVPYVLAEPDGCTVVEVDGTPVAVRGSGDFTERDREMFAEVVRAAKRRYEAETAAEQLRTVPVRPTPRLIRELVEGAATQGEHCPERTRTREGRIVTCAKAAAHHGSWHRNGRDIWKVTHIDTRDQREDDHAPHDTPHPRPLHRVVAELRTALRAIASGACGCPCRSADVAREALAVTDAPRT